MTAIALMVVVFLVPIGLLITGMKNAAMIAAIVFVSSLPSIVRVLHLAIKGRKWPVMVGGPRCYWHGRNREGGKRS
jgi:hypothetical protein